MIPKSEWKWFGTPGHLIVAQYCRFHLCTQVGKYLVSTVGEYVPPDGVREILAKSRGIVLEGRGDARESDWVRKVGYEEIGCGRTYETMVFEAGGPCERPGCDCGLPEISGSETDFRGYSVRGDATTGHYEMCEKWAAEQ